MPDIVLTTINARHAHASLGLRYLRANLGDLHARSSIVEFVLGRTVDQIAERLLAEYPRIVCIGVYIWNVDVATRLVERLKAVAPDLTLVIGGPEVSHEVERQPICRMADYVVTGWGDVTFATLARQILAGPRPLMRVHAGVQPPLESIVLPYAEYTDADLRHRYVYVEASRGCPFKCEFCLSALDRTAWAFPLEPLLATLETLLGRGARHFKFVDRTFNLKVAASARVLAFFLAHVEAAPEDPPFVHFELIPDHLPDALKGLIARFPPGTLQLEIGVQTFDPDVQRRISRAQDNAAAEANLTWLREHSSAHLHVDLIAGLPGEALASFAAGFDRLVALRPHEIQVGILKRLRGAPIARHTEAFGLRFNSEPPYNLLASDTIDAATMQRLARFARYWELVANSGRFPRALPLLLGVQPFARFMACADWLHRETGRASAIANETLYELLHRWLVAEAAVNPADATATLASDYLASGARGKVAFIDKATRKGGPSPVRRRPGAQRQARRLDV